MANFDDVHDSESVACELAVEHRRFKVLTWYDGTLPPYGVIPLGTGQRVLFFPADSCVMARVGPSLLRSALQALEREKLRLMDNNALSAHAQLGAPID